jgi:hypothetical protein
MPLTETLAVTCKVAKIFEQIGAPCVIGGSVASSLHGIPRATQDSPVISAPNCHQWERERPKWSIPR